MIVHYFLGGNRSRSRAHRSRSARKRATRRQIFALRPRCETMEDRTLLATMLWASAVNGDWDVASNWVNSGNSSDHHVPTSTDDAVINQAGITITHNQSTSYSVNSISIPSNASALSISSGTLSIAATSNLAGGLNLSGGTLSGTGSVNVSGPTTWTGGTMSGSGVTAADGGLAVGGTAAANYFEYLSGRELDNYGAATLNAYAPYSNGFYVSGGAVLDNEAGGTLAFGSDTSIYANGGTPSGGTFVNQGKLSKTGGTGTSVINVALTDTGTIEAASGTLQLSGGGTFAGTVEATSGGSLTM